MPALRAVAYYRMSTDKQEASIPEQRGWAHKAAKREGVELVREFQDEGLVGGEIERRPDLMEMAAFCEREAGAGRPVEAVLCWDADRLSRADSMRTAAYVAGLLDAGVSRMLTPEGWIDWSNDIDRVLYNLKQDLSRQAFSKSVSKNVTRGMAQRAADGFWVGSTPPYAYRVEDHRLTPGDPAHVEVVRWIFRTYCDTGSSLADIARELNKQGVAPPRPGRGQRWTRYTVRGILTNPRYTGDAVWNETHFHRYHRFAGGSVRADNAPKRRHSLKQPGQVLKNLPRHHSAPEDIIIKPDAHPALIDRETYAQAQRKLRDSRGKRTTPLPGGGDWTLSGLLYCGHCHSVMWGARNVQKRGEKVYVYRKYLCSGSKKHGRDFCPSNCADPDTVLEEVVKLVQQKLADPEGLAHLRAEMADAVKAHQKENGATRQALRARHDELAKLIERGNENLAVLPADRLPGVIAKVRGWEKERDRAAEELARLDQAAEEAHGMGERVEEALALLQKLHELIGEAEPQQVRDALGRLVQRVELFFDHQDAPGSLRGNQTTELSHIEVELHPDFVKLLGRAGPNSQVTIRLRGEVSRRAG